MADWTDGLHGAVWADDEDGGSDATCLVCGTRCDLKDMPEHLASVHEVELTWPDGQPVVVGDVDDLLR